MYNLITLISILFYSYIIVRLFKPSTIMESALICFFILIGNIILLGYLLSWVGQLSNLKLWAITTSAIAFFFLIEVILNKDLRTALKNTSFLSLKFSSVTSWFAQMSLFEKVILYPLTLTTVVLGCVNLLTVMSIPPHNHDSMTFHLARMAYYIQQNSIEKFDANYWAQVVHPKNAVLLNIFTYIISGFNENLTQLVQFIAYCVAILSVYGTSMKIGFNKTQGLFAAMIFALLTECLMQATTTQNEMIITALTGGVLYFLLAFKDVKQNKYLILAALGTGISLGIKSSFLLILPLILILAIYIFLRQTGFKLAALMRNITTLLSALIVALLIFALPAGYIDNYKNFANPIGPEYVRKSHSFEGRSISYVLSHGSYNMLRYGIEFLSLDGLPPIDIVYALQKWIRFIPKSLANSIGVDLESREGVRSPFFYYKIPVAHEDFSYWGILGFGLIWIVIALSFLGFIKIPDLRMLSFLSLLFFILQSYSGYYDPWRGRYFIVCAVFAVPTVVVCLISDSKWVRSYLIIVVLIGCISAITATLFRTNGYLFSLNKQNPIFMSKYHNPIRKAMMGDPEHRSIFALDRISQLTINHRAYYQTLKNFDELVPKNAAVAVCLRQSSFEYPLFGEGLTRKVIPINSVYRGIQSIPEEAEYLLFSNEFSFHDPNEIHLGLDWYLLKLK